MIVSKSSTQEVAWLYARLELCYFEKNKCHSLSLETTFHNASILLARAVQYLIVGGGKCYYFHLDLPLSLKNNQHPYQYYASTM